MKIVNAAEPHIPAILDIFNAEVRTSFSIWTEREDTLNDRRAWVVKLQSLNYACIVALDENNDVLGYGGYAPFKGRPGYDISVEHSVYVANHAQGKGVGKALMAELINRAMKDPRLEKMIAAIDSGNPASIGIHEHFGFEQEGLLQKVAKKFGEHRDLLLMAKDVSNPTT